MVLSLSMVFGYSKNSEDEFQYYFSENGTYVAFKHSKKDNLDLLLSLNDDNTYTIESIDFVGEVLYLPDCAVDGRYITGIGINAFREMNDIKSIRLPEGVTSLGWRIFSFCPNLEEVILGRELREIKSSAFWGVDLERIKISDENTFFKLSGNSLIERDTGHLVLGTNQSVISSDVTEIGDCAFAGRSFETFFIPSNVQKIGTAAFSECEKLHTVTISEGVYEIQDDAFLNCYNLENISIPKSMNKLGASVFEGTGLKSIPALGGVTELRSDTFSRCNELKKAVIPAHITAIGNGTFAECESLEEITLPDKLEVFDEKGAFYCCWNLRSISISSENPRYMTIEGKLVEKDTMKLLVGTTDGEIPNGVKIIAEGAFACRGRFTSITIPESVTEISDLAFADAKQLSFLYIPESVTVVGKNIIGGNASNIQIYCESEKPSQFWDKEWIDADDAIILWGVRKSVES